jgi:hypothetical protein
MRTSMNRYPGRPRRAELAGHVQAPGRLGLLSTPGTGWVLGLPQSADGRPAVHCYELCTLEAGPQRRIARLREVTSVQACHARKLAQIGPKLLTLATTVLRELTRGRAVEARSEAVLARMADMISGEGDCDEKLRRRGVPGLPSACNERGEKHGSLHSPVRFRRVGVRIAPTWF